MKKFYLLVLVLLTTNTFSQINSPNGNNLFLYNGLADVIFKYPERGSGGRALVHNNGNVLSINFESDFSGGTRIGNDVYFKDGGNSSINTGNFGIGTTNPLAKFQVSNGNILVRNALNTDNSSSIMIAQSINEANHTTFGTSLRTITQSAGYNIYGLQFFTQESYVIGQTEKLRIQGNGNVGIGTTNPDEKLTVNGKIHAQEVRIDISAPMTVPDYVFAKEYKLKSLQEVESFIKQNSHLPEIPSAKEFEKDGIQLAEMNLNLLKKIEELTLYAIEQQKNTDKLMKIVEEQNKRLEVLEKKN